ncbi:MAG: TonB-dependent receptor [Melioribacter sp.]|nr:TonB-dependent receptor [Melioribacter sp.]
MKNFTTIRKLFFFTIVLVLSLELSAQQRMQQGGMNPSQFQPIGKISGTVIDAQTSEPIEYANIVIYKWKDSTVANGTVTDQKGKFELSKVMYGRYFMKVSYIGYSTKRFDSLTVIPNKTEITYGLIKLRPKNVNMNEVVVQSQRDALTSNLDKKVYTVDKLMANSGGTAVDVMQNIPSVSVDADGGVAVRGNTNINVLVDGRPAALAGFSGSDVLSQIPASQIESIEIVTNPSAKYDPEGTAGIINVILKKNSNLGVNGTLMGNAGTKGRYNSSVNLNLRGDNFNVFSSYDGRFFNMSGGGTTLRNSSFPSQNGNINSTLDQNSDNQNRMNNHSLNIGADYYLADKEFVTLSAQFRFGDMNNGSTIGNINYTDPNNIQSQFNRVSDGVRNNSSGNYTLSYKKTYENKNQELTGDVMYSQSSMNSDSKISQLYFIPNQTSTLQRSLSDNANKLWLIQANYVQPLGDWGRLESGLRSQIKDLTMFNDYLNWDYSNQMWGAGNLINNNYNYKEQVHALYGIFSNSLGSFTTQIGLRAEQVFVKGMSYVTNQTYESNYFDIYPTVHLRYDFNGLDEIQLSYSRRIDRPQNRQLNPYEDRSDSLNVFKGNPDLRPQYHNALELGYTKTLGKTSLVTNLFYRLSTNLISTISTLMPNGVTYSTFQNISKGKSYGVEFVANSPITDWMRLNGNISYYNNSVDDLGTLGGETGSYSWSARLSSTMTISDGFIFQMMFFYSSPSIMLNTGGRGGGDMGGGMFFGGSAAQTKMKEMYSMDVMVRKDFMDGRLAFTLRISDLFNSRKFNTETTGLNYYMINTRKFDSRIVNLGISYRLVDTKGKMMDQEKQRRIEEGYDEL